MKEERYFYLPNANQTNELPTVEAQHAVRVLRLKEGDSIKLMDGKGMFYTAKITLAAPHHCHYEIIESAPQCRTWNGHIHLAIAPTKDMGRMEWMIEKATEVGFDEITFIQSQFSERQVIRTDRVEKIVISAMKQSRKAWKPIVNPMTPFETFINQHDKGSRYICHCYLEIDRSDFFNNIKDHLQQDIIVMIGPEGDFSINEVRMAMEHGYQSSTLGESRLRTETAGLSAVMMSQLCLRKTEVDE